MLFFNWVNLSSISHISSSVMELLFSFSFNFVDHFLFVLSLRTAASVPTIQLCRTWHDKTQPNQSSSNSGCSMLPPGSLTCPRTTFAFPAPPAEGQHLVSFDHTRTTIRVFIQVRKHGWPKPLARCQLLHGVLSTAMNCLRRLHDPISAAPNKFLYDNPHLVPSLFVRYVMSFNAQICEMLYRTLHTTNHSCCSFLLLSPRGGFYPPLEVLDKEHLAVLTDVRKSDCTSFFDLPDHVPEEIRAPPHDTLREIVPGVVILPNLTLHFGCCLLCPPRQLFVLKLVFFACLRNTPKGMVRDF